MTPLPPPALRDGPDRPGDRGLVGHWAGLCRATGRANGYDLVVVGRREDRLAALAAALDGVAVQVLAADLSTAAGIDTVAEVCADQPLSMLVTNAGVAHYMPMVDLSAQQARELVNVKVLAPTMLTRAALAGMIERRVGTIINVAGMIAFSGPAEAAAAPGQRAVYTGSLAGTLAMTQTLNTELKGTGVSAHVLCPGIVATEFHEVQGMDLSAIPRMAATDVVTAALTGIEHGEVVIAPGVETTPSSTRSSTLTSPPSTAEPPTRLPLSPRLTQISTTIY